MAQISRSTKIGGGTTLTSNTTARAADVETDALTLFNAHNNHDTGASKWQVVSAQNTSSTPLICDNSSGTNNIFEARDNGSAVFTIADGGVIPSATFTAATTTTATITTGNITTANITTLGHTISGYRRPNLKWISITQVDVENNTGTANQTTIIFPDGSVRSVTEDTSSTNKYRRFDITATANFTSGTEDAGLRSSLSEATNTWYAMYAVKSSVDATKFVLVGDTTLPTQANFSTLNTNLNGANSWVYLGLIRNGDNSGATGDILAFIQAGNRTTFANTLTTGGNSGIGTRLATTAGATSVTYTYAAGTGTTNIPNNITLADFGTSCSAGGTGWDITAQTAATRRYFRMPGLAISTGTIVLSNLSAADGLIVTTGSSTAQDIYLAGYVDNALSGVTSIL